MENRDPIRPLEDDSRPQAEAEADAEAALERTARQRRAMSAREFVSERDAVEDAWAGSRDQSARDEGW